MHIMQCAFSVYVVAGLCAKMSWSLLAYIAIDIDFDDNKLHVLIK